MVMFPVVNRQCGVRQDEPQHAGTHRQEADYAFHRTLSDKRV
jgi:hypothetical protein